MPWWHAKRSCVTAWYVPHSCPEVRSWLQIPFQWRRSPCYINTGMATFFLAQSIIATPTLFFWHGGKNFSVFTLLTVFSVLPGGAWLGCGKARLSTWKLFWDSSQGFPSCPKWAAIFPFLEPCCLYREAVQNQLASCLCCRKLMV